MAEEVGVLDVPAHRDVDTSSPLQCLRSMGLLSLSSEKKKEEEEEEKKRECVSVSFESVAAAWETVGGVRIGMIREPTEFSREGKLVRSGVSGKKALTTAPMTICTVRISGEGGATVIVSANRTSGVVDVCSYDPSGVASEGFLYDASELACDWVRSVLGDGWGMRAEVYHESPPELAYDEALRKSWLPLMVLLKPYAPHVRMMDTQSRMREECANTGLGMDDVVREVVCRIAQ